MFSILDSAKIAGGDWRRKFEHSNGSPDGSPGCYTATSAHEWEFDVSADIIGNLARNDWEPVHP